ncbi:hypothetical protein Q3G72_005714 [Acer saccharum]|nr:hypothetical protein Q3G72_005714 [Acer saccharum]
MQSPLFKVSGGVCTCWAQTTTTSISLHTVSTSQFITGTLVVKVDSDGCIRGASDSLAKMGSNSSGDFVEWGDC